jgi:hypothetical protein
MAGMVIPFALIERLIKCIKGRPFAMEVFVLLVVDRKGIYDMKQLVFLAIGENDWTNEYIASRTMNTVHAIYYVIMKRDLTFLAVQY